MPQSKAGVKKPWEPRTIIRQLQQLRKDEAEAAAQKVAPDWRSLNSCGFLVRKIAQLRVLLRRKCAARLAIAEFLRFSGAQDRATARFAAQKVRRPTGDR